MQKKFCQRQKIVINIISIMKIGTAQKLKNENQYYRKKSEINKLVKEAHS